MRPLYGRSPHARKARHGAKAAGESAFAFAAGLLYSGARRRHRAATASRTHGGIMGITLVIVGGLILLTFIPVYFDYRAKLVKRASGAPDSAVRELSARVAALEEQLADRDSRLRLVEKDLQFVNRLLEDKSK